MNLLTFAQIRDRFPETPSGYRPSERWLREAARRLGLAVPIGKEIYLPEEDWDRFIQGLKELRSSPKSAPVARFRPERKMNQASERALKRVLDVLNEPTPKGSRK